MEATDLQAAQTAIKRSSQTRARLRGKFPEDRDERLRGCLDDLSAVAAPIAAHLRSQPLTGRRSRNREAREMSAALQAERAKVRAMLRRASGGARSPATPYRRAQFQGAIRDLVQRTNTIENELDHALPQFRRGTAEYRSAAEDLLERIDRLQQRLTTRRAQARYWWPRAWGKITVRDKQVAAAALETADRLKALRKRAKAAIAVPIDIGFSKAPTKRPTSRRRWTDEEAYEALLDFTRSHGRLPKARDLPNDPTLPSYATIHDLFGGLQYIMDDLRIDAKTVILD